ncbi:16S rRNA (cytosine(967)-C(5))-methyltransferase [Phormidium sp. CCY1219]|uniref:16S rRNA (cytosine(967)-C(5))-methyltransferase n=1 Tax=Phormidium sp. CCY1219 TaxID=2886104 RepID=UPI002D1F01B1|nr:16S rRNA (cytosine(967)-C(5))-methyltransferase [Phormidium sp. CCY1219]MEB3826479.1 16S rRNA (cytosine(967)-C(5))-methyltransferase [Phormidium sp. CCY1219]
MQNPRQLAFLALRDIDRRDAFADVALDKWLHKATVGAEEQLLPRDRRLATELVYGCVRRRRTLDAAIDQLAKKKAHQQPRDLRIILHLGLYQLRYLDFIPPSAVVDTTVELAKANKFKGLAGFVNGVLRQYLRLANSEDGDPLKLPADEISRLGISYSFPDWIVAYWVEQLGVEETQQLCEWFNHSPTLDLRVNPLRSSREAVETALKSAGVQVSPVPHLPQALRLSAGAGAVQNLPGYGEGWWTVQDSSAQLVGYLLAPQPGEVAIDACAAPGGKTTHIAELMGDEGTIWACDRTASRLKKVPENAQRLQIESVQIVRGDSRELSQFQDVGDRVVLDAPCSGLGTLHRRADARWRQTPENIEQLSQLQGELLAGVARWVKPGGVLVYATCTLHPLENEAVIREFLRDRPHWRIEPPESGTPPAAFATSEGWIKVWPHQHNMDGFFMVRLRKVGSG